MGIRITMQEKDMLKEVKNRYDWKNELKFDIQPKFVILESTNDDLIIELRELCSDYLQEVGFDDKYEPDEKGILLESLIDKLYVK